MPKIIHVASVLFESEAFRGEPDARSRVLRELDARAHRLRDRPCDLAVFSEGVEAIGQNMEEAESLEEPGELLDRYALIARENRCVVAGSVKLKEEESTFNAIVFFDRRGVPLGRYCKTFLTDAELDQGLSPGPGAEVVACEFGRIGGLVCFDLNFSELCDAYADQGVDLLCFASMYHGGFMQAWWAHRCRAHLVSALTFHGGGVVDPLGQILTATDCYNEVAYARINLDCMAVHLDHNRDKLRDIERRYGEAVSVSVPPNLGLALLRSESGNLSVQEIVEHEQLLTLDDYFSSARRNNAFHRH